MIYNDEFESEKNLQDSIENIEYIKDKNEKNEKNETIKIIWKSSREIIKKNVVILPEIIDYSNFNQGYIGDCYFISCVNALSQIPQLLHYIMGLTDRNTENENPTKFVVNFFIDGRWEKIYIEDSFPFLENNNELIGVQPKDNELFMMILEKAWAKINGGYDRIEGGISKNIFELFLGCKCNWFYNYNNKDDNINNIYDDVINDEINSLYESVKENEKTFGTLSLCSSPYYYYDPKKFNINIKDFDKEDAKNKRLIKHNKDDYHAYTILKTLEFPRVSAEGYINRIKILIISNPHGKSSDFIGSGIELKKIKEILEQNFGKKNKLLEDILIKNEMYDETGVIFMPLEYYKEWSSNTYVCYPHYSCISYTCSITNELNCLYIFKIELNKKQILTCQVCFQSYRAHPSIKENYFNNCRIKIIENNEHPNVVKNCCHSSDKYDRASIQEENALLEKGQYFVVIYPESSVNDAVIRFLTEEEIDIKLINKIDIYESNENYSLTQIFSENDDYKHYLNLEKNDDLNYDLIKEDFLPGIKEYYIHFKKLAEKIGLSPQDAIYKISNKGDAFYYKIIEPQTLKNIFKVISKKGKIKNDFININTIQFYDNFGIPYKVSNLNDLVYEMKKNKNPFSCLYSNYDSNINGFKSMVAYFNLYHNKAINEDILVISDKQGNFLQREQKPLFIIILDISVSMCDYHEYLQNKIIPKLLKKLGYFSDYEELLQKINEHKISNFEILQSITNKTKFENFIETYKLGNIKLEHFKKYCEDIITLITFSDDAYLYFYLVSDFEKCHLSGDTTYFKNAANYLNMILNSISNERSIRLLNFSDGAICDQEESIQILDQILNSDKVRHQMNSVSVRVCHDTEPDTKVLMKLSAFSYPKNDMTQVIIDTNKDKDDEVVVNKLYDRFINDDMIYYLKLKSDIIFMSDEFSDKFSKEIFFNKKNTAIRIRDHRSALEYQNLLKISGGKIMVKDCGELKQNTFYDIMEENAPFIAQRILERKVNQKGKSKENQEIIDYFEKTEEYLDKVNNNKKKKKLYQYFKEINENEEIKKVDSNKLSEIIYNVKNKVEKIIENKQKTLYIYFKNYLPINIKTNHRQLTPDNLINKNKYRKINKNNNIISLSLKKTQYIPIINSINNIDNLSYSSSRNIINNNSLKNFQNNIEQKPSSILPQNNNNLIKNKINNNINFSTNNLKASYPTKKLYISKTPIKTLKTDYNNKKYTKNFNRSFFINIYDNSEETDVCTNIHERKNKNIKLIKIKDSPQIIKQRKIIINKFSLMNMSDPNSFNKSNFNLFYTSPTFFQIPQSEIKNKTKIIYLTDKNQPEQITYEGEVNKKNQKHGLGKLTQQDSIKIGMWKNDTFTGWGREIKKSGQVFEGKFVNDILSGKGVYKYNDDALYIGDFENGIMQGNGILLTKKFQYNGMFRNNQIDGYGIIIYLDPRSEILEYEGSFKRNKIEGNGIMKKRNGDIYKGEVKNGKMNGSRRLFPNKGIPFNAIFKDNIIVK